MVEFGILHSTIWINYVVQVKPILIYGEKLEIVNALEDNWRYYGWINYHQQRLSELGLILSSMQQSALVL